MTRFLSMLVFFWVSSASAELPASVERGWNGLIITLGSFFAVFLIFAVAGAIAARRISPASRAGRQAIFATANLIGLAAGAFVALKVVGS